jgi:hypothetical protein
MRGNKNIKYIMHYYTTKRNLNQYKNKTTVTLIEFKIKSNFGICLVHINDNL